MGHAHGSERRLFGSLGKGSVKDGKMGLIKHGPFPGEDEPLHAYVTGATAEMVAKAVEKVKRTKNRAVESLSLILGARDHPSE